ncbi:hypothetical protein HYPGJ_30239 [Hyphomicrobium sp. GJ21]|nr:hypothetical protein HYPGJ_30239 [Hyphomicrobium sp. GJ21]
MQFWLKYLQFARTTRTKSIGKKNVVPNLPVMISPADVDQVERRMRTQSNGRDGNGNYQRHQAAHRGSSGSNSDADA